MRRQLKDKRRRARTEAVVLGKVTGKRGEHMQSI